MEARTGGGQQKLKKASIGLYRQRQPLETIFHQVIAEHFPNFIRKLEQGDETSIAKLPDHVEAEFDAYLKCGLLEHGFVKMSCEDCKATLLVPLSCKKRGFCPSCIGKRMNEGASFFCHKRDPKGSGPAMGFIVPDACKILDGAEPKTYVEFTQYFYEGRASTLQALIF